MDCPNVLARLADLASGDLSPQEGAELSAHLKGCPTCRAEWEKLNTGLQRMREFYAHFDPDTAPAAAGAPSAASATHPSTQPATGPGGFSRRPARVPEQSTRAGGEGRPSSWETLVDSLLSGWRGPALAFSLLLVAGILLLGRGRIRPGPGPHPVITDGLPVLAQGAARLAAGQVLVKPGEPFVADTEYLILEPATVETPTGGRGQLEPGSRLAFAGNGVVRLAAGVLRVGLDTGAPGWRVETPTATVTTPDRAGFTLWVAADHTLARGEDGGLSLRGAAGTIFLKEQEWGLVGKGRPPQVLPPGAVSSPPPTGGATSPALARWLAGLEAAAMATPTTTLPATITTAPPPDPASVSETMVATATASPAVLPDTPLPPATATPDLPPAASAGQAVETGPAPGTGSATLSAPGEVFDQAP